MPNLADIHTCTGCLACVDVCHKGALSSCYNEEGHLTYQLDRDKCVECGLCERTCPVVSKSEYGTNKLSDSIPYAAWAKDDELRAKSTSGGVFASLARYIISQGGVVVGASLEHNDIKHILIEREEDLIKLQGSKYAQSYTEGIYKTVKAALANGKAVLFSGLGCQVAGLLSYLGKKEFSGRLYTVDLICGGVPSRFIIDKYLERNPDVKEIAGFRNKSKYEFSVINIKGEKRVVPLAERPFPLCGFYTELTNRYSCYNCQYNGAHRKSDLTIGDYWGDKDFLEEHVNGLSVTVVHSEEGNNLLKLADIECYEIEWGNFLMHNPRMIDGYKDKSKTYARKNLAKAFKTYPYDKLLQVYANAASWNRPMSMIKKLASFIIGTGKRKLYSFKLKRKIKKLNSV